MTVTDTVTSFAHDAAHVAEDLGKQAIQLGRAAVAAGSDVAASAATHAQHLAKDVKKKVPVPHRAKKRTSWKLWIGVGILALVAAAAFRKSRAASNNTSHTSTSAQSGSRPDLRSTTTKEAAAS